MTVIDRFILKGRCIVISNTLQKQTLEQLHINHMGMDKIKPLCESIYWPGIDSNIEKKTLKNCSTCLEFQQTKPKEQIMHQEIPEKPWEVVGADMFNSHNKYYLCIINYHSKFPIIKKTEDLAAASLTVACKLFFQNMAYLKK